MKLYHSLYQSVCFLFCLQCFAYVNPTPFPLLLLLSCLHAWITAFDYLFSDIYILLISSPLIVYFCPKKEKRKRRGKKGRREERREGRMKKEGREEGRIHTHKIHVMTWSKGMCGSHLSCLTGLKAAEQEPFPMQVCPARTQHSDSPH